MAVAGKVGGIDGSTDGARELEVTRRMSLRLGAGVGSAGVSSSAGLGATGGTSEGSLAMVLAAISGSGDDSWSERALARV